MRRTGGWLRAALAGLFLVALGHPARAAEGMVDPLLAPWTGDLSGMHERGYVRILTSYSRTHFFLHEGNPRGLEAELMRRWSDRVNRGVSSGQPRTGIVFIPVPFDRLIPDLIAGRGDIAAAGLTITPERSGRVSFSDPYLPDVSEVVVASSDAQGLDSTVDLAGRTLHVVRGSSYVRSLRALSKDLESTGLAPITVVEADEYLELPDILELVNAGVLQQTVADLHVARVWARVMPELRVRDDLAVASGRKIAWATRPDSPELAASLNDFVRSHRKGTLTGNVLIKRYFESTRWIENPTLESEQRKLDKLIPLFEKYGARYDIDWLLLAAQAYRESRLDNSQRSRAGAVGIMQVRPETAADPAIGIHDVYDLENNIHAGAKYLAYLRDRYFSNDAVGPDARIHFSQAAYNAGPARVRRLRNVAREQGLDPNRWFGNVELVALAQVGREPVLYVADVRKYYVAYLLSRDKLLERDRRIQGARLDQ